MPNIKSKVKRMKKSEEQRLRNRNIRSALRTDIKKFRDACESGEGEAASDAYRTAARSLDRAVSKGVIHKNKAATQKSKMSRALNGLK